MKFMNMHISKKQMYLIGIIVGAIIIFSFLKGPREGFNNYISTGDSAKDTETFNDSYVAPAGDTVLYNMKEKTNYNQVQRDVPMYNQTEHDEPDHDESQCHRQIKRCKHKKHQNRRQNNNYREQNWSRNDGPLGIPRNQIPTGDEDLYILKSEVIPPVCPACPNVTACTSNKTPPPCPPCARCPEPAFDCKKVPNYNSNSTEFLPRPVLADFSQFGM